MEITQRKIFKYLLNKKIENFIGVPDSTLKYFIDEGLVNKKIIITTREEEAIGIGVGMTLSSSKSLIFMQNAGFANSLSTITSLVQLYQIPLIFLIGWRGYLKNDAPEHTKIGKIQQDLLKLIGLNFRIITDNNWKKSCDWALAQNKKKKPCSLIIRREHLD
ncbi:Putative thiamine-pyrophosphate-binding protein [Candidatus Nitrosarchaeum limnium SFB1]|jgi:sulfopyruvate decarboxylase TPP-binding subunit|uniref:sulfopyruvate decarboxylase n=1 Tax=Candidatus Nitrosarchaeum limnium SFB1 TaxID=886738 RepID=F3KMW5_9ARCH|nr:Putative thiamine-pyrophosphate-binding protein [Candidatus Nitrosarchaeum limnium SFB1]